MATPQDRLESLFDPPPPAEPKPRAPRRAPQPAGGIESLFDLPTRRAPAPAALTTPPIPAHPHGAFDSLTEGSWSIRNADALKDWYRGAYGRELPVSAAGQSATHNRMGLDHSDSLDVRINPTSEEGQALREYLRANRVPFLAYDRAVPGAATAAHIHIGFPSHGGRAGEAARLGSIDGLFDPSGSGIEHLFDSNDLLSGQDAQEGEEVVREAAPTPMPATPKPVPSLYTTEGRALRDAHVQAERGGRGLYRLPVGSGSSDAAVARAVAQLAKDVDAPVEYVRGWLGQKGLGLYDAQTHEALQSSPTGYATIPAEMVGELRRDYAASLNLPTRAVRNLAEVVSTHTPGEMLTGVLNVAGEPAGAALSKGAELVGRLMKPFDMFGARLWTRLGGGSPEQARAASDAIWNDEPLPAYAENFVAADVERDMARLNPRIGKVYGVLTRFLTDPTNFVPVGGAVMLADKFADGVRAFRAARGVEEVAEALAQVERVVEEAADVARVGAQVERGAGREALEGLGYQVERAAAPNRAAAAGEAPEVWKVTGPDGNVRIMHDDVELDDFADYVDGHASQPIAADAPGGGQVPEGPGAIDHLFDPPESASAPRSAAAVAEDIRVTHARERADFYSREAAGAKDPVHRAEAERLAREYADEAEEARVSNVAQRVKSGANVAPEEMADLERAVLAEDGTPTYVEVELAAPPVAAPAAPKSAARRALGGVLDALDATKSTFASADISFPGRQGIVPFLLDSRATLGGEARGLRAVSSRGFSHMTRWLEARPSSKMWQDFGLKLETLEGGHTEMFSSRAAENIPVAGRYLVRPSDRVMTAQADAVRLLNAESWDKTLRRFGATPEKNPEDYAAVAKYLNAASGNGDLGKLGQALYPVTRRVLFSPKLLKSRFMVLNPLTYERLPATARKVAGLKLGKAAAKIGGALGLAYLTADEVGLNPTKGNFLHARYGDTTYDLSGGFAQKMAFPFRLAQSVHATAAAYRKGKPVEWKSTPWGVTAHFLRSQLAPSYSLPVDAVTGETYDGQPFSWVEGVIRRVAPGVSQDVWDGFNQGDGAGDALKSLPSFFGVSTRTRDREALKRDWADARRASKEAEVRERTLQVMRDEPAAARDDLVRLRVPLSKSDAGLAREIAAAVERARTGPGWSRLDDAQRRTLLRNVIAGVRKEAGAASAERAERAAGAKEGERVGLVGRAAEEVERLGVVVDPVFAGHKVGVFTGESVGFKGEHLGQTPEQLEEYRRRLAEETQREVERVMSFDGFDSQSEAVRRGALQAAVDRVRSRLRGEFHFDTRRRDYSEHERLEEYQRSLEGRSRQLKPGEKIKL